jgi:glycosyltransferase involved in cell wall biosynthesis
VRSPFSRRLKIVALPRDPSPYQRLLYREIERAGHSVRYAGEWSPSHTLNLLLLPLELAVYRLAGWRVLHVHWVFAFQLPGSDRFPALRQLAQAWFCFVLAACRTLGIRVVWTVHNVLPHERVFHDDVAARRRLVRSSELVYVHSGASLEALEGLGARPRRSAFVAHGPLEPTVDASVLRPPGADRSVRKLLFFGQVVEYKGVEDLLGAMIEVPSALPVLLTVAGQCDDEALRESLSATAALAGDRVELKLAHVPQDEVTELLADSDVVVLPFRRVTTSGSMLLAMGHGRVVLVPDLPAFGALPRDAALFYDGTVGGLRQAIVDVAELEAERLREVGAAASAYVGTLSWADAAQQTITALAVQR